MKSEPLSKADSNFLFEEAFDINEIQKLQDLFSEVNEVASIITQIDGTPITKASNFTRFCFDFIRKTETGRCNCFKSDAEIGRYNPDGPTVRKCLSGGLWDAGVSIRVGDIHVANWLIGQIRNDEVDEKQILRYAEEIGVDCNDFLDAYNEVPVMSGKKFRKVADLLYALVKELADRAYQNLLLKSEVEEKERAIEGKEQKEQELIEANNEIRLISQNLPNAIWKAEVTSDGKFVKTYISDVVDDLLCLPKGTINNSFNKFFSYVEAEELERIYDVIKVGIQNPGNTYTVSYNIVKGDNTAAWFQSVGRIYVTDGKSHLIGTTIDITEQKQIQNKLNESEEKYRSLLSNLPVGVFRSTIKGEVLSANQAMAEIYGYDTVEELLDVPAKAYYNDVNPRDQMLTALREKGFLLDYQTKELKKDGSSVWISANYKLVESDDLDEAHIDGVLVDITKRKEAENELVEAKARADKSRQRFELAMQVTLDGPWDWNLISNEIYFSPRWKEILGYKPHEIPDDFSIWEKLTKPEDVKRSWDLLNKHISGEIDKFEIEFQMLHKDGHWVDILSRAMAQFDENGKAFRVVGTHIDISERNRAEKQLKENEERFRKLTEHLPSGIAIYRPVDEGNDFEFIDVNKRAEVITNASREELVGSTLLQKFPKMINSPVYESLKRVSLTGKDDFIPSFYYKDAVREGWRENYIYKLQSGEIVAIFRDTTEIKEAEENLKKQNAELMHAKTVAEQNQARFKALHDATFGGIAIHDKGKILDCNRGLAKLTGLKRKQLIGMDGLLLIAERSRKKVMKRIVAEYTKPYEAYGVRKNGEEYPLRLEGRMIPYKGKQVRVVEFRDITELKKAEHELIAAKEKAEESDRLKSAFLANMSHEIRTPMNGILGFTSLLQEPDLTGEMQHRYIDIIQQSGDRMLQTVNDIIEVSKIETGQVSVTKTEVNIQDLLEYLFNFFKPEAEKKEMELIFENLLLENENLIFTDEIKLNSILTNLIKNAIKYSEKGVITFVCQRLSNHLKFSVKDQGIGIPANRLQAIFDRFVQADIEDTKVHEGSGLGLTITKSYAKMLGGEVWVESKVGKGSTFYATIEYNRASVSYSEQKQNKLHDTHESQGKIEILVAEDDDVSFILLENMLSNDNYGLTQVRNGKELIDVLKQNTTFDLILMDIKMPEMDGIEATKVIRTFNPTIPIIAQTAYALAGDREKALEAGCNDYLSKPINKIELIEKIKKNVVTSS